MQSRVVDACSSACLLGLAGACSALEAEKQKTIPGRAGDQPCDLRQACVSLALVFKTIGEDCDLMLDALVGADEDRAQRRQSSIAASGQGQGAGDCAQVGTPTNWCQGCQLLNLGQRTRRQTALGECLDLPGDPLAQVRLVAG